MSDQGRLLLSRRDLLKAGGLAAVAAGAAARAPAGRERRSSRPRPGRGPAAGPEARRDGRLDLPAADSADLLQSLGVVTHPDSYAPDGRTTYIFGFANATRPRRRGPVQPEEQGPALRAAVLGRRASDFRVQLTNVGLAQRPDLFDEHTVHWHGFKNVIPFFDGEPTRVGLDPAGPDVHLRLHVPRPGTYMFHCHVEDTEHVHMGMTGLVFVRPAQDGNTVACYPSGKYAYNDGDGSTGLRPRVRDVPERGVGRLPLGGRPHPAPGMERLPGRLQPPQRAGLPGHAAAERLDRPRRLSTSCPRDANWDLPVPGAGGPTERTDLGSQPMSVARHLQRRRAGPAALREPRLHGSGDDPRRASRCGSSAGTPRTCAGATGFDTSYETNTLSFGAGESFDAIFTAPAFTGGRVERPGLRHLRPLQPRLHPRRQPRRRRRRPADRGARLPGRRAARPAVPQPAPGRRGVRPAMSGVTTMRRITRLASPHRAGARGRRRCWSPASCCRRPRVRPTAAATEGSNTGGDRLHDGRDGWHASRPST